MANDVSDSIEALGFEHRDEHVPTARMSFLAAFFLGCWYSIILGAAMSAGVKYLHPETPAAHGVLQSFAWAIGSGIAVILASRLSHTRKLAVGLACTFVSAAVWLGLLYLLRDDVDQAVGETLFGHSISLQSYLLGFACLIMLVGVFCAFLGSTSRNDEEVTAPLFAISGGHWLWLWIAAFGWVSTIPIILYYVWLQIATAIFSLIHPSLWFQVGSGLFFGFLGIVAFFKGIEISLRSVSESSAYGGTIVKRTLMFVVGTVLLVCLVSPFLLNLDISRMKEMPESVGAHPWFIL
jgi:hypothetical protein